MCELWWMPGALCFFGQSRFSWRFWTNFGQFWRLWATFRVWATLGHFGPLSEFGLFLAIWANLGCFGPLHRSGTLGHFGPLRPFWLPGPLSAILGHFWGLAHSGTFWATYGVPILGFRFGYDQVDCVAPVFKKRLTWISAYPLSPLTSKGRAPCNWKRTSYRISNISIRWSILLFLADGCVFLLIICYNLDVAMVLLPFIIFSVTYFSMSCPVSAGQWCAEQAWIFWKFLWFSLEAWI